MKNILAVSSKQQVKNILAVSSKQQVKNILAVSSKQQVKNILAVSSKQQVKNILAVSSKQQVKNILAVSSKQQVTFWYDDDVSCVWMIVVKHQMSNFSWREQVTFHHDYDEWFLFWTGPQSWIFTVLAHWNSSSQANMSLHPES